MAERTTYHQRIAGARPWEQRLQERLNEIGWLAAPFGQAQIPEAMRPFLRAWMDEYGNPTLLRWTPDIVACRPALVPFVCLIDAKTESAANASSPNYAIEINAVDAGLTIVRDWHMPLYYVWSDGGVLTPNMVLNRWNRKLDGLGSGGSGTAFYLVAKAHAIKASSVFRPFRLDEAD